MNWLAHVYLSEPNVEFRLGNLLADLVRGDDRRRMPSEFLRGVQRHLRIDAFTDAHPIVRASRARISARHRRFAGVLVDIFYDYFLARSWPRYCSEPLADFTARFYAEAMACSLPLPHAARETLEQIVAQDLLSQYQFLHGVERSLQRLSAYILRRWRRDYALAESVQDLIAHEAAFAADFAAFFPLLRAHVAAA